MLAPVVKLAPLNGEVMLTVGGGLFATLMLTQQRSSLLPDYRSLRQSNYGYLRQRWTVWPYRERSCQSLRTLSHRRTEHSSPCLEQCRSRLPRLGCWLRW